MAIAHDIATAITSALTEIGITGVVGVAMSDQRVVQVLGEPIGADDVRVTVTVEPMRADDAEPPAQS